ncbi:MAG: hypothetical protein KGY80_09575 [Candidatus Thorarchaeota archaeon]|nr:hypothetical protein [Candidatus Thorarchaeota archaeon]
MVWTECNLGWGFSLNRKRAILISSGILIIVIVALFLASIPRVQVIHHKEYSDFDFYPEYYVTNFTIKPTHNHPELIIDIDVEHPMDSGSYLISWRLYNETLETFQESFNLSESKEGLDGYWGGWQTNDIGFPLDPQEELPVGSYVFVFWIERDNPTSGWTVEITLSLRTYLIKVFQLHLFSSFVQEKILIDS